MHRKVFIVTDTTNLNNKARPHLLGAGEIGLFGIRKDTLVQDRATTTAPLETMYIALGKSNGNALMSPTITLSNLPKKHLVWQKTEYRDPVKPIVKVSTDCEGLSNYDDFVLSVQVRFNGDLSGTEIQPRTYTVTGKYTNPTDLYNALADAVNADEHADVIATGTPSGVELTPKDFWAIIDAGFDYVDNPKSPKCQACEDCVSTVEVMNQADLGAGTARHVRQAWLDAAAHWGTTYRSDRIIPIPRDLVVIPDSAKYDTYYLKWSNGNQPTGDHTEAITDFFQEVQIFVPQGTDFEAVTQVISAQLGVTLRETIV